MNSQTFANFRGVGMQSAEQKLTQIVFTGHNERKL
jgi:hypothetical protein